MPAGSRNWPMPAWRRKQRNSVVDHGDRLDLDHCIGIRKATDLDCRAGRRRRPEVVPPHVAVLREFRVIGNKSIGLDDIGEGGARRLETGLDVFADLLDLRAHVALADTIAVGVAGKLPGDKDHLPSAADRDDVRIGRVAGPHYDMEALRLNLLALDRHPVPFPYNAGLDDTPRARPR